MSDRLKIGQEVLIHGYVDEIRKDTIIIQNEGGYFGTVEYEVTDIEMPNTNDVLNKIRAEIADAFIKHGLGNTKICFDVLQIIDRKGEQHD